MKTAMRWTVLAMGTALLGACSTAGPKPEASASTGRGGYVSNGMNVLLPPTGEGGGYKIGKPYQVDGVWYRPKEDFAYDREGVASWYGPGFHAKYTANGEIFDENAMTAAHPTLPMPSIVEVTNLENGRAVKLRVNDRGPFKGDRIIDVSRRAAQMLGFEGQGTARVRVRVLANESRAVALAALGSKAPPAGSTLHVAEPAIEIARPSPAVFETPAPPPKGSTVTELPPPAVTPAVIEAPSPVQPEPVAAPQSAPSAEAVGSYYIQVGAFSVLDNARRLTDRLSQLAPADAFPVTVNGKELYRVRVGPFATMAEAEALLPQVHAEGAPDAKVVEK